eukprot:scaffold505233_cov42-Prasinocladus_malaysianus.AAC.2
MTCGAWCLPGDTEAAHRPAAVAGPCGEAGHRKRRACRRGPGAQGQSRQVAEGERRPAAPGKKSPIPYNLPAAHNFPWPKKAKRDSRHGFMDHVISIRHARDSVAANA